ncbi:MAG: tyrosine-protein phosphatase [Dysgonomonas sp.]
MIIRLITCVATLIFLFGCSSNPSVTVLCEQDPQGNYLLKWEIYPEIDSSTVEIFVSDNDSVFPPNPELTANSNDYIAVIENTSKNVEKRKYFKLKVDGRLSYTVSNRFFELDSIQNFRDIGGYATNDHKRVRWGKIFRSGSFARMTTRDSLELNSLGIKTVIDLRSKDVKRPFINHYNNVNNIRIPISYSGYNSISQRVMDGRFLRGDAIIYTQDLYRDMIFNFSAQYAEFIDYLCDEGNYPIVYNCYLGKDQSGLATYFLLRALDVPIDVIEDDYLASVIGIDKEKSVRNADSLSESRQEAFTMLTKTDLAFLKYGVSCIREKSGSIDDYMLNELKITPEKKQKLKKILLESDYQ